MVETEAVTDWVFDNQKLCIKLEALTHDMNTTMLFCLLAAGGVAGLGSMQAQPFEETVPRVVYLPNPYAGKAVSGYLGGSGSALAIKYHGGPIILGTVNAYVIWYGSWSFSGSTNTPTSIVTDFLNVIGGSPYYNINTTYYNGSGTHLANAIAYAGYFVDNYSQGSTSLTDGQIQQIVSHALNSSPGLPADPNGIYFVLTSPDVTKSGFCTSYCGWHTRATINNVDIKYSFVGDAGSQCPSACTANPTVSPNGDVGGDGMVNVIAHELEEAASDEDLNAWYDSRGYENADKCAWTFGTTSTLSNGAKYNMTLPTSAQIGSGNSTRLRNYLIQRNWVNAGSGYCAISY